MKKALSLLLTVLMLFTIGAVTLASAAEGDVYTIKFVNYDGTEIASCTVTEGSIVKAPQNPTRESTETTEYIFKGWSADGGKTCYHESTIPLAYGDVTYTAVYGEQEIDNSMTFWQFIKSIFDRINAIFEYFDRIFSHGWKLA